MDRWGESRVRSWQHALAGELRRWRRRPSGLLLGLAALALGGYVIVAPLAASRYPLMTDLPFHTAYAAILRHYHDPAWHFREQFALQPLAVPYLSTYALAALLMTVCDAATAMKITVAVTLALLPVGLAVLFHGMRKSPLLGLSGLGLVWCGLTSWGFVNFMGALGLFALAVGLTLRLLDRPSVAGQWALGLCLVALFFTHVFRFPFALGAVVGTTLVMAPATRRWRPVVAPLLGGLVLLGIFWLGRPPAVAGALGPLRLDWRRLEQIAGFLYRSLRDPAEAELARRAFDLLVGVAVGTGGLFLLQGRWRPRRRRDLAWGVGVTLVPLGCAALFFGLYLALPMEIGIWWYVYPREVTAALFVALGALPDLPRQRSAQAGFVVLAAVAVVPLARLASDHAARFHEATRDFDAVVAEIPRAPKLLYLVFDHHGSAALHTPFIHLPAYVQAARGGWLSFHFASWGASPIVYRSAREPGAVVPPPTPLRWEWTPERFQVERHGAFFDWFLVRRRSRPDALFRADPTLVPVAHQGTWWLYCRTRPASRPGGEPSTD